MYPMPHELKDTVKGSHSVPNKELRDKYGFDNWYDWALHNWDTKWDVDFELIHYVRSGLEDYQGLEFNSAWGPPMGALQKFVDRYPKGTFEVAHLQYIESGMQFCGVYDALDDTKSVYVNDYVDTFEDYDSNKLNLDEWFSESEFEWLVDELEFELSYHADNSENQELSKGMSEDINDALCDAYDIQKSFDFKKVADKPKDNDGTSITLKDCIDNIVYRLEALKEKGSQELSKEDT